MVSNFCTYFDFNYLIRGLALYGSLVRNATPFRLWVLCCDDLTHQILRGLDLPEVSLISLKELEKEDQDLLGVKGSRSRIEYYFTCTAALPLYILRKFPEVHLITYLDADLFFFASPSPIYEELGSGSVLIAAHRFPPHMKHLETNGVYNVGFLSFRSDEVGLECLGWWRERCLEWCYDRVEDGRFGDQKYLDEWPARFKNVVVVQHKGAGLAPWNVVNYSLRLSQDGVKVDSETLIFFHFHGLRRIGPWFYDPNWNYYGVSADRVLKRHVYGRYIRQLQETARWVSHLVDGSHVSMLPTQGRRAQGSIWRSVGRRLKYPLSVTRKALRGDLCVMINGRVV